MDVSRKFQEECNNYDTISVFLQYVHCGFMIFSCDEQLKK